MLAFPSPLLPSSARRRPLQLPRHDRASEQDDWDCVDVLVDEETFSQAVAS